ncbi:sporulation protein rmd1 [Ophidiomyces ophidiicola]|nr:sporulation protein rmd1 [Ophidiomyces ophidiicola]KAI1986413.1 sporulation protein rmd1 [Ophidiomyces ophidiicola]KAI2005461.1 sporulation protein rmd1 [Ophidiomyces ophidiicola]KAI2051873.1 sporulation protein rmd1 [Ophidiomyces ophidiicola]KAI2077074.1 sporulation protein rmd1 [Ophidiomyces ophidiicola]
MASTPSESSSLLQHAQSDLRYSSQGEPRPPKTVSFGPDPRVGGSTTTPARGNILRPLHSATPSLQSGSGQPVLAALNSKLRRRHSQEPPLVLSPPPKIGPQRTTKNTQKLKLLPNPVTGEDDEWIDEAIPRDVYSQIKRIKEPTARRDAARLGKADRDRLPRVTAYGTANSYRLEGVMKFFKSRVHSRGTNPKLFDECVYSPYNYGFESKSSFSQEPSKIPQNSIHPPPWTSTEPAPRRFSDSEFEIEGHREEQREQLLSMQGANTNGLKPQHQLPDEDHSQSSSKALASGSLGHDTQDLNTTIHTPEVFLFDYGTVVIWGMTPSQETRFLNEISKFADSVLSAEDMQVENFNFYYTRDYQARIYNDFISLRDPRSYMTKLAISHALSQSVKTSLFEDLVSETIASTAPLPAQIAQTGSVNLTRRQINMQIGELFILRINIHLQGSVLDSPELMWAEPQLDPIYQAMRSYLEMDQRVGLLTERLDVIADLLAVLKDQLSHRHGEYLEWIVIVLIAAEILIAGINIIVDLYAGVD